MKPNNHDYKVIEIDNIISEDNEWSSIPYKLPYHYVNE